MRVLRDFLTPAEVEELAAEWLKVRSSGWTVARGGSRSYEFVPCLTQFAVTQRALALLPKEPWCPHTDSFFLNYLDGDKTPIHRDGRSGSRLNACLKAPDDGGVFTVGRSRVDLRCGDAVVFAPARETHAVSKVVGQRLIWSVGRTKDEGRTKR